MRLPSKSPSRACCTVSAVRAMREAGSRNAMRRASPAPGRAARDAIGHHGMAIPIQRRDHVQRLERGRCVDIRVGLGELTANLERRLRHGGQFTKGFGGSRGSRGSLVLGFSGSCSGPRTQDPRPRTQDPRPKTQDPKTPRPQDLKTPRPQAPKTPRPKPQTFEPSTSRPQCQWWRSRPSTRAVQVSFAAIGCESVRVPELIRSPG